jgi:arylsulfatase A-like enzyme
MLTTAVLFAAAPDQAPPLRSALQTQLRFAPNARHLADPAGQQSLSWVPWVPVSSAGVPPSRGDGLGTADADASCAALLCEFDLDLIDWSGRLGVNRVDYGVAPSANSEFEYEESLEVANKADTLKVFGNDSMSRRGEHNEVKGYSGGGNYYMELNAPARKDPEAKQDNVRPAFFGDVVAQDNIGSPINKAAANYSNALFVDWLARRCAARLGSNSSCHPAFAAQRVSLKTDEAIGYNYTYMDNDDDVAPTTKPPKKHQQKPHIVFCLVDDLGWNTAYNNPAQHTPTIDSLAAAGVKLTSFYTYRYCSPTRASFLTGRLPYKLLNIRENLHSMASPDATDERFTMLPKRLKEAQYWSIQIGKWHQGAASFSHTPVGRGFDESYGFLAGGEDHYSQVSGTCHMPTASTSHDAATDTETTSDDWRSVEAEERRDCASGTCWTTAGTNDKSNHMGQIHVVGSPEACCANCSTTPGCKFFLCVNQSSASWPEACRCLLKRSRNDPAPWSVPSTYGGVTNPLPAPPPPSAPMVRLGAIDYDNGEASPVMFGGWPLLLESISSCHPDHAWHAGVPEFQYCPSYLRVINLTNGLTVSNISGSCNHTFGSAMVVPAGDGRFETMFVFATRYARFQTPNAWCPRPKVKTSFGSECQNATTCVIDAWSSTDQSLQKWTKTPTLKPGFRAFNTDVVKLPTGAFSLGGVDPVSYAMAVEHPGGPNGWSSTIFVTNATSPVSGWVSVSSLLPGAQDAALACPCIRYADGMFYVFGAAKFIDGIQSVDLLRSADLKTWEPAKRSLVSPSRTKGAPELRAIAATDLGLMTWQPAVEFPKNGRFGSVSDAFFNGGWNVAASDLDAVEIEGGYFNHTRGNKSVLVHWCLNDQHQWGFGELGLFDGSMAEWLQAPYDAPPPPPPHHPSSVSTPITDYWQETSETNSGKAIASCMDIPDARRHACPLYQVFAANTSEAAAAQLCKQGKFANCAYDNGSAATHPCYQCKPPRYTGYDFTSKAVAVIKSHTTQRPDNPLFIYLALHNTHMPCQSPPEFFSLYHYKDARQNTFEGMVSTVDSTVKNVTTALRSSGLWARTLFVWATDNGSPVNGGGAGSNYPLRGSKGSDFEGGTRVPAFLSGGVIAKESRMVGKQLGGIVAISDLFTTFASLAGVNGTAEPNPESPAAVDGMNLWPYFTGAATDSPRTEYIYDHLMFTKNFSACVYVGGIQVAPCNGGGAIRVGDWKLMVGTFGYAGHYGEFSPNASWKPAMQHMTLCSLEKPCLFNVGTGKDEAEHRDVAASEPAIVTRLLARFHEFDHEYHPDSTPQPEQIGARCRAVLDNGGWTSPWLHLKTDDVAPSYFIKTDGDAGVSTATKCAVEGMGAWCKHGQTAPLARCRAKAGCAANMTYTGKGCGSADGHCTCDAVPPFYLAWVRGCVQAGVYADPIPAAECQARISKCMDPPPRPSNTTNTVVFRGGTEGYHSFRIPSLLRMDSGVLLVFAEGRGQLADHGRNDIVLKRSEDNGTSWSKLQLVYSESTKTKHVTIGNPSPIAVRSKPGRIVLLACRENKAVVQLISEDNGLTFGSKTEVPTALFPHESWVATGPATGLELANGRLLVAADHYDPQHGSHAMLSDDGAQTWQLSEPIDDQSSGGGNECQAAQLTNGSLVMNMRTLKGWRQFSWSHDNGSRWTVPVRSPSFLEIYGGGTTEGSTVTLDSGSLAFSTPFGPAGRANLTVFVSEDGGLTYELTRTVDPGPAAYSSLASDKGKGWLIAYESGSTDPINYDTIRFASSARLQAQDGLRRLKSDDVKHDNIQQPPTADASPLLVHVAAATGSDTGGDGSSARPFASPTRAAAAVRGRPGSTVLLAAGFYPVPDGAKPRFSPAALKGMGMPVLDLYADDSGAEGAPITYAAEPTAPAGSVVLSAGAKLPGASIHKGPLCIHPLLPAAAAGRVSCANLTALGITDVGDIGNDSELQLFLGGQPMHLARYPNLDPKDRRLWRWLRASGSNGSGVVCAAADASRLERWAVEADPWVHAYTTYDWHDDRLQVVGFTSSSRTLEINCTEYALTPCPEYSWKSGARYLGFNLLSELDEPGEYYLENSSGMLYWWPLDEAASADPDAIVTVHNVALHVEGGREWERPVQHLVFENLTFAHSRGAAALLREVANISLLGCSFLNSGGQGVGLVDAPDSVVMGGVISGVGGVGIAALAGSTKPLISGNLRVEGLMIRDFARVRRTYNPAVQFGYPDSGGVGTVFAHLNISDGPHQAFSGYCNDCIFEYNTVAHLGYECADSGAWYSGRSWVHRGNIIRHNSFTDIQQHEVMAQDEVSVGVYADDQLSDLVIYNNSFTDVQMGVQLGGGRNHSVFNNSFVRCGVAVHLDARGLSSQRSVCAKGGTFEQALGKVGFTAPPWSTHYKGIAETWSAAGRPCTPVHNRVEGNQYCNCSWRPPAATQNGFWDSGVTNASAVRDDWLTTVADNVESCEVPPVKSDARLGDQPKLAVKSDDAAPWSWDHLRPWCLPRPDAGPGDSAAAGQFFNVSQMRSLARFDLVMYWGVNTTKTGQSWLDGKPRWVADEEAQSLEQARLWKAAAPNVSLHPYIPFGYSEEWFASGAEFLKHPDWFLRYDDGTPIDCHNGTAGEVQNGCYEQGNTYRVYDWCAPGVIEFFQEQVIGQYLDSPLIQGVFFDDPDIVPTYMMKHRWNLSASLIARQKPCAMQAINTTMHTVAAKGKQAHMSFKSFAHQNPEWFAFETALLAEVGAAHATRYVEAWCTSGGGWACQPSKDNFNPTGDPALCCVDEILSVGAQAQRGAGLTIHGGLKGSGAETFALAAFMMAMEAGSFYSASSGWGADSFPWVGEFDRPLGQPKSKMVHTKESGVDVFRREFEHASAEVFVQNKTANINWGAGVGE